MDTSKLNILLKEILSFINFHQHKSFSMWNVIHPSNFPRQHIYEVSEKSPSHFFTKYIRIIQRPNRYIKKLSEKQIIYIIHIWNDMQKRGCNSRVIIPSMNNFRNKSVLHITVLKLSWVIIPSQRQF